MPFVQYQCPSNSTGLYFRLGCWELPYICCFVVRHAWLWILLVQITAFVNGLTTIFLDNWTEKKRSEAPLLFLPAALLWGIFLSPSWVYWCSSCAWSCSVPGFGFVCFLVYFYQPLHWLSQSRCFVQAGLKCDGFIVAFFHFPTWDVWVRNDYVVDVYAVVFFRLTGIVCLFRRWLSLLFSTPSYQVVTFLRWVVLSNPLIAGLLLLILYFPRPLFLSVLFPCKLTASSSSYVLLCIIVYGLLLVGRSRVHSSCIARPCATFLFLISALKFSVASSVAYWFEKCVRC